KVKQHGVRVVAPAEAAAEADVVMILTPDTGQARLYKESIAPGMGAGKMLMFAHGFNIRFGTVQPAAGIDVTMVAPKGPGHRLRETFVAGGGVPALLAVHADATGKAPAPGPAYAPGLG